MNTEKFQLEKLTDQQLIVRFAQNREELAFVVLIERHGPWVMRLCRQWSLSEQDAEDSFQAVFLVLAQKSRSVRWQSSIANWLYGVAWRIAKRARRQVIKQNVRMANPPIDLSEIAEVKNLTQVELESAEQQIYPTLYQLADKYRAPIILCHLEGLSRGQAASQLGLSESVVKGRLERGLHVLRKMLSRNGVSCLSALTGGALAAHIASANAQISQQTAINVTKVSTQVISGASVTSVSSVSAILAKGELFRIMAIFQIKVASIVVGLTCFGLAFVAGTSLFPQTQQSSSVKNTASTQNSTLEKWKRLDAVQRDLLTQKHLKALMGAVHRYVDDHQGKLPPASVPNPKLPVEKRLSGLVLLLPYLNAKEIYRQIDLSKAWDDPANAKAAKAIVEEFLSADEDTYFDPSGRAVTHFALVRGSSDRDNGMFPLADDVELAIPDIADGTSETLAIGQIHTDLGPWIAAGPSTARFVNPPSATTKAPGFGSKYTGAAYFANGDGFTYFWDLASCKPEKLHAIAGRDDRVVLSSKKDFVRYSTAQDWKKAKKSKDQPK